jgi:hypothetical protein
MEDAQQASCHCCLIDFLSIWELMWYPHSGKSLEPKLLLEDLFDRRLRLIEVLRNNSCNRKRKFFKEIGESLPQNVRRTTKSEFVFTWKVTRIKVGTPLFDVSQWISCRAGYGGQFSVNYLGAKIFEEKEFDDKSLLRFFDPAKWRRVNVILIIIIAFTVMCRILPKIIYPKNDQIFRSFQVVIVVLR